MNLVEWIGGIQITADWEPFQIRGMTHMSPNLGIKSTVFYIITSFSLLENCWIL